MFGASFKAQVALSAVRGEQTTAELASKYGVQSSQVTPWKQLLDQAAELFEDGRGSGRKEELSAKAEEPYEQIFG